MPMNIGKMRHRVDILTRSVSVVNGVSTESWAKTATVWSSVEPVIGREYFIAAAVQAEDTVRFRMRYRGVLPEETRLSYSGNLYDVYSAHCPEERKAELVIMGKLVTGGDSMGSKRN